jgi:hypothetical protein
MRKKWLIHDRCGRIVSNKTLRCSKCGVKPNGNSVTLIRRGK